MTNYSKFAAALPYPSPNITYQNPEYAKLLLEDYCNLNVSEFTALSQYIYGHFVIPDEYAEIADALRGIAIVEMKHLELLAETISKLGVDPRFRTISRTGSDQYWAATEINYAKSINNILLDNIEGEKLAIAQYRMHISMIDDPEITALLKRIIIDEELHIEILNQLYINHNTPKDMSPM